MRKKQPFLELEPIMDNLVSYKNRWLMAVKVQSIDIEMRSPFEVKAIFNVFQQVLKSFHGTVQYLQTKNPLDFSSKKRGIQSNILRFTNESIREYGETYMDYLDDMVVGKLSGVNYFILATDGRCSLEEAKSHMDSTFNQLSRTFGHINLPIERVIGAELQDLYRVPSYIREEKDYLVYGDGVKRTYIITDYPRMTYPNWLKPVLEFPYPMELSQFYHPYQSPNVVRSLEVTIAKLESTIEMQRRSGDSISSELRVKSGDTDALLNRIVSGEDKIIEASFYVTLSAPDLNSLNQRSQEFELYLRQIGVKARRAVKEAVKAYKCCLPLGYDAILDTYTFDTRSLTSILPLTAGDYGSKDGIIYGTTHDLSQLIMLNRFNMMNPNMIILGTTGAGKSMFLKTVEIARQIIDGAKVLIIDHNGEYKRICDILGGLYIEEGMTPNWNHHLIVFNGDKPKALRKIWTHITQAKKEKTVLVIDEFHNILLQDKDFMLLVMREIRKYYVAPTLSTQNIRGLLQTEEGKMIMDLCSIKVLMKQGESDLEEVERLFRLSDNEKLFLMTAPKGRGYIYTDQFKSRFRVDYSEKEEELLSTNPMHTGGNKWTSKSYN